MVHSDVTKTSQLGINKYSCLFQHRQHAFKLQLRQMSSKFQNEFTDLLGSYFVLLCRNLTQTIWGALKIHFIYNNPEYNYHTLNQSETNIRKAQYHIGINNHEKQLKYVSTTTPHLQLHLMKIEIHPANKINGNGKP